MAVLVSFGVREFVEEDGEDAVIWTEEMGLPAVELTIPPDVGVDNSPSIIPNNAWFSRCMDGDEFFSQFCRRVVRATGHYLLLSDELLELVEGIADEHDDVGVQAVYQWTKVWARAAKEKFADKACVTVLP